MGLFMPCEGDVAILIENGVFKQVPLYMRNGYYFAKLGGGFVRLNADGSTSKATARLDTMTTEAIPSLGVDPMGRLCDIDAVPGAKGLPQQATQKLLGIESE
jgi:hypothetical protein